MRPPWFSKPASTCGPAPEVDLDRDVADQARAGVAHGFEVHQADAREALAAQLVGVAEQLVAAADREDDAPALGRGVQRVALDGRQVLRAQLLVTVLTAAEVEEVVGVRIDLVAEAAPDSSKPIPRHSQRRSSSSRLPRSA